jgi:NADPH:quinone reductase-like Zn-dependent oxidoreductase
MTEAIVIHQTEGPEVLQWEDFDPGPPKPGEALVRHEAVGLNFIDVYHRTGLYPLDTSILAQKGSLFLTRPSLMTYTARREDLLAHAKDLFQVVAEGAVKVQIGQTYALKEAKQAHMDLEGRKTRGSTVLRV